MFVLAIQPLYSLLSTQIAHAITPTDTTSPNNLRFTATNINGTAVSGCDVATNGQDVVAHWDDTGVKYNYRSWTDVAGSAYSSEASAYVVSNVTMNSLAGALNQGEGNYWFEVQAIAADDSASLWSSPCKITYDKTKPGVTLMSSTTHVITNIATLTIAATDDKDLSKVVANIYKDGVAGVFKPTQAAAAGASYTHTVSLAGFAEGDYSVKYNALDKAGNMSPTGTYEFTVDNTGPTATLAFPNIGSSAKSFNVRFDEDVNAVDAANPANYFLENWPGAPSFDSLVGHALVTYDSATKTATVTFIDPAWYVSPEQEWGVRGIHDTSGNEMVTTTAYSTPPNGPLFGTLSINENQNDLTWTWSAIDPETTNSEGASGASGIKEYEYQLMRGSDVVVDWTKTTSNSVVTHANGDGEYAFHLRARDNAGNESGLVTITAHLDTTAPILTMGTPVLNEDGTYTVQVTTTDSSSDILFYLDGTPISGATSNDNKTVWTITTDPLSPQTTHTIAARSTDASGNAAAEVNETFTVPVVNSTPLSAAIVPGQIAVANTTGDFSNILNPQPSQQEQPKNDDTAVLGAQTLKDSTGSDVASIAATPQGWKIFGIAWYWILLILIVLVGLIWAITAAARRHTVAQDV